MTWENVFNYFVQPWKNEYGFYKYFRQMIQVTINLSFQFPFLRLR